MSMDPSAPRPQPIKSGPEAEAKTIASANLFEGQREICIEHDGVRYRLRITRRNKLILQK